MKVVMDVLGSVVSAGIAYVIFVYWPFQWGVTVGATVAAIVFVLGVVVDALGRWRKKGAAPE